MVVVLAGTFTSALLSGEGRYLDAAVVALGLAAAWLVFSGNVSIESILWIWFLVTPLASFYLRFPGEKSLLTFDRAVFGLSIALLLSRALTFEPRSSRTGAAAPELRVSPFEIAWAALSVVALANALLKSNDFPYALRLAVDSFWLPLIAFRLARYHFDIRSRGGALLLVSIALALFLFAIGAYEFAQETNLFPYKGSEVIREGELRVNGPFASDSSYAIICALVVLLLRAAPRIFGLGLSKSTRVVYSLAVGAAVAGSLLPMFRTVAVALAGSWALFELLAFRTRLKESEAEHSAAAEDRPRSSAPGRLRREKPASRIRAAAVPSLGGAALVLVLLLAFGSGSNGFGRLSNPLNVFVRLATWEYGARMALDYPVTGVGLANYADAFDQKYGGWVEWVLDTKPSNAPHSNLLWVWAELGVIGLLPFVIAHGYLVLMGYRSLRRARRHQTRTAAACYIGLLAAYWIPGLTLASGYYSDLNLYFFFGLGLLLNAARCGLDKKQQAIEATA